MSRQQPLNATAKAYVLTVIVGGLAAVVQSLLTLASEPVDSRWLLLAALTLISGSANVKLTSVAATISVSETFVFTAVLLFGPGPGTITVALDAVVLSLWLKRQNRGELYRLLFNIAAPAISIWIAAHSFFALAGVAPLTIGAEPVRVVDLVLPLLVFTLLYFLLNSWLIAIAISLKEGISALGVWRDNLLWLSLNYFGGASVAALLVGYRGALDVGLLLIIVPILLVLHFTFKSALGRVEDANRHLARVNALYLSTIETLATAIDAKDQVTHGHIRRVQLHATTLAREVGVKDDAQLRAIEAAALLHDMGKLAVPDYILNKPGPLSSSEFELMKRHAAIGAEILSAIEFPYPVVPIVRHHHESWDGTGYPDGLKGTEIPIGARILSVVDCFDALTSDRPYRPRLSDGAAIEVLKQRRGTMYDPLIVDTFMLVHERLASDGTIHAIAQGPGLAAITQAASSRLEPLELPVSVSTPERADLVSVYELGRALSFRNLSVKDVAALVSGHLQKLVESRVYMFFLPDYRSNELFVAYAVGENLSLLEQLRIPLGQRLSGWVAVNRGTIINSEPVLDLGEVARNWQPPLTNSLSVALTAEGDAVGVLSLYSDRKFTQDDARVVEIVSRHVSGAFRSALLSQRAQLLQTDTVTGLPRLEYVNGLLASEIRAALRGGQSVSILVFQLETEVTNSQESADSVMAGLTDAVRRELRSTDVFFRSDNGEFVVAMPQTHISTANQIAARFFASTSQSPSLSRLQLSIGTASAPSDGEALEILMKVAKGRVRRGPAFSDASISNWT